MASIQVTFKGGKNNGQYYYVNSDQLQNSYFLPLLTPDNPTPQQVYHINGIFQFYELYVLERRLNGEARFKYQSLVPKRTVDLTVRRK